MRYPNAISRDNMDLGYTDPLSFTACGPPTTTQRPRHTAQFCPETSMRSSHTYKTSWQKGW